MAARSISVDDILDEMRKKSGEAYDKPLASMDHVDDLIKEILEQRQMEQLRKEKRALSLKEKMELEEEIKIQTKTLTAQFKKLKEQHDTRLEQPVNIAKHAKPVSDFPRTELEHEQELKQSHLSPTQELHMLRMAKLKKEQQIKLNQTTELFLSREFTPQKEEKLDNLKKAARAQVLNHDKGDINGHFGKVSMQDADVEAGYERMTVNPVVYKELKSNRGRVIDAFVLDPKKPPLQKASPENNVTENAAEALAEEILQQTAATGKPASTEPSKPIEPDGFNISSDVMQAAKEKRSAEGSFTAESMQTSNGGEYEYRSKAQREDVRQNLKITAKKTGRSLTLLAILSVAALALLFSRASAENMVLAGLFPVSPAIYAYINLGLLIIACISGFSIFSNAFASLAEHKADKDVLYAVGMIFTFVTTAVICMKPTVLLTAGVNLYVPILILLLAVNFLAKSRALKRILSSFDQISGEGELYAATSVTDRKAVDGMMSGIDSMGEVMLLRNVKTGFIQNFLAHSFGPDSSDSLSNKMLAAMIPASLVVFVVSFFIHRDLYMATSLASAVPLVLIGFITSILTAFPLSDAAGVVEHFAGVMPDFDSLDCFCETDAVMLEATDLFNNESVLLHGIKTFQGKRIDNAIVEAASVLCKANSILKTVFLSIIANQESLLKPVDSIIYEDGMGISSWVNEKRVLIGNRALMINHSIAVPKEEYEKKYREQGQELIYLSSEGELCAAFVLQFTAVGESLDMVDLLLKNNIAVIIKSMDACVTPRLVEQVFGFEPGMYKIIPARMHSLYEEQHDSLPRTDGGMANKGGSFSMVVLVAVCKRLMSCIRIGKVMHIVSACFGVLLLIASLFLQMPALAGGLQLFLFIALFGVAYWLYEKNVKL